MVKELRDSRLFNVIQGSQEKGFRIETNAYGVYGGVYDHDPVTLRKAFATMRKSGLLARQNIGSSSADGSYKVDQLVKKRIQDGKPTPQGVAYYATNHAREESPIYLAFHDTIEYGSELTCEEVGVIVCEALAFHGIPYTWDGDRWNKILIHPINCYGQGGAVTIREELERRKKNKDRLVNRVKYLENELQAAKDELAELSRKDLQ